MRYFEIYKLVPLESGSWLLLVYTTNYFLDKNIKSSSLVLHNTSNLCGSSGFFGVSIRIFKICLFQCIQVMVDRVRVSLKN